LILPGQANTAVDLARNLEKTDGISVDVQTARDALKKEGMKARVKRKKPLLSKRHKQQRREFAEKYKSWTAKDWSRVIFSDETKTNRIESGNDRWTWTKPAMAIDSQHVAATVKHGGGL
jgi:GH35 family endo-1,4-beta-xylanase